MKKRSEAKLLSNLLAYGALAVVGAALLAQHSIPATVDVRPNLQVALSSLAGLVVAGWGIGNLVEALLSWLGIK